MRFEKVFTMPSFGVETAIKLSHVPEYLRESELYATLCNNSQDAGIESSSIMVPTNCVKQNTSVENLEDLEHLFNSMRYWSIGALPNELVTFCIKNSFLVINSLLLFQRDLSQLDNLCALISLMTLRGDPEKYAEWTGGVPDRMNDPRYCMAVTCLFQGQLSIMRCLHNYYDELKENPWSENVCSTAACAGNLAALRYAHQNGCAWNGSTCYYAARAGSVACLQYAHENGCPWKSSTCTAAARACNLDCLVYAHANGCAWDYKTCSAAALAGSLTCLKYAHENGCQWNGMTCSSAARAGNVDCLEYAHENGCKWDFSTCNAAARSGNLACLTYAHENGCAWDSHTCALAAGVGSLDCLVYAHENGCAWDKETCKAAAKEGHLDCLAYAKAHSCPIA